LLQRNKNSGKIGRQGTKKKEAGAKGPEVKTTMNLISQGEKEQATHLASEKMSARKRDSLQRRRNMKRTKGRVCVKQV